jgi:hypothetical protein
MVNEGLLKASRKIIAFVALYVGLQGYTILEKRFG